MGIHLKSRSDLRSGDHRRDATAMNRWQPHDGLFEAKSQPISSPRVPQERVPTSILDYHLDPALIAREPASPRDAARLMVVHRRSGEVEHRIIRDLPKYLRASDLLVVNRTRVMPARLRLRRDTDGRESEALLESPLSDRRWRAFLKQSKRFRPGDRLILVGPEPRAEMAAMTVGARDGEAVEVTFEGDASVEQIISRFGWTPLPPYIRRARERVEVESPSTDAEAERRDRVSYQTIYARADGHDSIAAPTAGLHFTGELLEEIARMGVRRVELTLQVGAGTFKPVECEYLDEHAMHRELFEVPAETLQALAAIEPVRAQGDGRVIAVGTTSVRALESLPTALAVESLGSAWQGATSLMITPTTQVRRVDALMTNFHLPRSTLLALVAAFVGIDRLHELYAIAQRERYRFYSFGDAMLIL